MIELFLPPVAEVARALAASGFAHFPSCLAAPVARALGHTTRPLPEERVVCGVPGASWLEQGVPLTHALAALLVRGDLLGYFATALGVGAWSETPEFWTSRFGVGEYIDEHCDARGSVQFLICLEAPPGACGGAVSFGVHSALGRVQLSPGDGLLFRASRIVHATEPLRASETAPQPELLVAVGRYFTNA